MIACICNNVKEKEIVEAIKLGDNTLELLCKNQGVCISCGVCTEHIKKLIEKHKT